MCSFSPTTLKLLLLLRETGIGWEVEHIQLLGGGLQTLADILWLREYSEDTVSNSLNRVTQHLTLVASASDWGITFLTTS